MMKKLISAALVIIMMMSLSVPAFAFNYSFSSGADSGATFGKSTSTDSLVQTDPMTENTRRNKDAAHNPPPYGVGSGNIPTEQSSLYHDNSAIFSGYTGNPSVIVLDPNTMGGSVSPSTGGTTAGTSGSDYGGMLPPTSMNSSDITQTLPLYYADGSIGTLNIPKLNLTVKVYSGETMENMRLGVGHFEFTSVWDGNVGICGHNRGVPHAIGGVKDLSNGDKITYTTRYGTRTYEVISKQQIADTDYSMLGWSESNLLTIVTCVEGKPELRWCVVARQVG
jgi:sortase A